MVAERTTTAVLTKNTAEIAAIRPPVPVLKRVMGVSRFRADFSGMWRVRAGAEQYENARVGRAFRKYESEPCAFHRVECGNRPACLTLPPRASRYFGRSPREIVTAPDFFLRSHPRMRQRNGFIYRTFNSWLSPQLNITIEGERHELGSRGRQLERVQG
jgi:hypothetical protein